MTRIDRFEKWICKTIYRTTHSRKYQHNKNLWPYFKVERDAAGSIKEVYFKNKRINNIDLSVERRTRPLLMIATGPSVNHIAPEFFDETFDYLGLNGAYSMRSIHFDWYVIIDRSFVINRRQLVEEIVGREDLILFCTYTSLEAIFSNIAWAQIRCQFKIFETANSTAIRRFMSPVSAMKPQDEEYYWHNQIGFSVRIDKALFDYGTVAYPALQIACLLGYEKIFIAGLDMNNFDTPRFYESPQDKLSTRLHLDFDNIRRAFEVGQLYCESNNIQVINLSPDSAINAFPKMAWDNVNKGR